ncbi:hypothetical protein BKA82DRAFT_4187438 [Pisolithus tinctorius]|nr:hypothetical protein BKA82DRAFT_4187438 [Pisolithus tinctorius]
MPAPRASTSQSAQHGVQLCVQISRESETTTSHSVNSGASSTLPILPACPAPTASHPRRQSEPDTVARQLFKYGFFFPLFWAIGVYFMFAPMREEEKEKILSNLRQTEMKWAKRCLWALLSFFVCMVLIIVAVVVASRRH